MVTNNKQTGRGRVTCPYQTELTDLLGHKHNIEPVAVSGRDGLIRKEPTNTFQIEEIDKENQTIIEDTEEGQSSTINRNLISNDENQGESTRNVTNVSLTQTNDNINYKLSQKQRKPGGTERMLQKCETRFEKIIKEIISKNQMKIESHREIMAEYKEIRRVYEEIATTMKEGFATANRHREERNKLLKTLIEQQQQNGDRE